MVRQVKVVEQLERTAVQLFGLVFGEEGFDQEAALALKLDGAAGAGQLIRLGYCGEGQRTGLGCLLG